MVVRYQVYVGKKHSVQAAVAADGITQPAMEVLNLLKKKQFPLTGIELPDSGQVNIFHRLLAKIKRFADGHELKRGDTKPLQDGIFEFRHDAVRISFYDTTGDGSYTPKVANWACGWDGKRFYYPPTNFDPDVRLGHSFEKVGEKTLPEDIMQCSKTREEDLSHDKPRPNYVLH